MALIYKIRRALGFGVTDDDEDYEALAADALKAGIPTPPFHEPAPDGASQSERDPKDAEAGRPVPTDQSARMIEILVELVRNSMSSPRFRTELNRLSGGYSADRRDDRERLLEELERYKTQAARIEQLETELKQARLTSQRHQTAYNEQITELRRQLNIAKTGTPDQPEPKLPDPLIEDLQRQLESREKTIVQLNDSITALKTKAKISDEMINNLNKRASQAREELKKANENHGAEIDKLEGQLSMAYTQIDDLKRRLDEVTKSVAEKDNSGKQPRSRRKNKKNKTEMENNTEISEFADASWLVSEPPADGGPTIERPSDPDFGYKEPPRNNIDVDDRQLSLW